MENGKTSTWQQVVDCAVSNSVHKKIHNTAGRELTISSVEKDCICRFIEMKTQFKDQEIIDTYESSVKRAKEQVIVDGAQPVWASIGVVVGVLGIITNVVYLIIAGFNYLFVLFLIVAISILSPCVKCIAENAVSRKAAKIWNDARKGDSEDLEAALMEMEGLFDK